MDMRDALLYELGAVPRAIAKADSSPETTAKSALIALLEKDVPLLEHVQQQVTIVMMDAMAILQAMTKIPATFGELSDQIFLQIVQALYDP